jgi:hypothetical protein
LAKQEKVTSCRATPGGFDLEFKAGFAGMARSYKLDSAFAAILRQAQDERPYIKPSP